MKVVDFPVKSGRRVSDVIEREVRIEAHSPLSHWPSSRILTICSCFLRAAFSTRSSSSIWSRIFCASASRSSLAAFSSVFSSPLVANHDDLGQLYRSACSALGVRERILGPHAPDAAFDVCVFVPTGPFGVLGAQGAGQVVKFWGREADKRRVVGRQ